jgi:hypothetical protein
MVLNEPAISIEKAAHRNRLDRVDFIPEPEHRAGPAMIVVVKMSVPSSLTVIEPQKGIGH